MRRLVPNVILTLLILSLFSASHAQEMKDAAGFYNGAAQSYKQNPSEAVAQLKQCVEVCDKLATDESADLKSRALKLLPIVHFEFASALYKKKDFKACIEQMDQARVTALAVDDKSIVQKVDRIMPRISYSEGLAAMKQAEYRRAIELLQKSVVSDPRNIDAFVAMTICQDSLKEYCEMLSTVEQGVEAAKKCNNLDRLMDLQSKGVNYLKICGQRAEESRLPDSAIAVYERAIRIDPREADVYSALAICYSKKGGHDRVIEYANLGLQYAPGTMDKTQLYFLKAKSLAATGDRDGACEAYREAAHGAYKEAAEHEMREVLKCK